MKYFYLFIVLILTGQMYSMERITIEGIVENIQTSVENKDHKLATQWLHRLELIVSSDWCWLDSAQIEKYQELYSDILDQVSAIEPQDLEKVTGFKHMDNEIALKEKEAAWLINVIENDTCEDFKGIEKILGATTKSLPSPETLKKKRISELEATGSLQIMKK